MMLEQSNLAGGRARFTRNNRTQKRQPIETLTTITLISMMAALIVLMGYALANHDLEPRVAIISGARS